MVKLIMEYSNKVNKKLEINQISIDGLCPINLAISKNCVEIVELILKYVNENEMKLIINEKDKEEFDSFLMKNDIKNFIKENVVVLHIKIIVLNFLNYCNYCKSIINFLFSNFFHSGMYLNFYYKYIIIYYYM